MFAEFRKAPLAYVEAGAVDVLVLAPSGASTNVSGEGRLVAGYWQVLTLRRGPDTRCTGAWEIVHGNIEPGELPEDAAVREVMEETGLEVERLYSISVNPFYIAKRSAIELAVVFAAVVNDDRPVQLHEEHDAWEWRTPAQAREQLAWPHSVASLDIALRILEGGDAGPREDVLRIR